MSKLDLPGWMTPGEVAQHRLHERVYDELRDPKKHFSRTDGAILDAIWKLTTDEALELVDTPTEWVIAWLRDQ